MEHGVGVWCMGDGVENYTKRTEHWAWLLAAGWLQRALCWLFILILDFSSLV